MDERHHARQRFAGLVRVARSGASQNNDKSQTPPPASATRFGRITLTTLGCACLFAHVTA